MKTANSLLLTATLALLAGCSNNSAPSTSSAAAPAAAPAARVATVHLGDVSPIKVFARPALDVPRQFVGVTMTSNPQDTIDLDEGKTVAVTTTEGMKFVGKGYAAALAQTFPVDSTDGEAVLYLGPQVTGDAAIEQVLAGITVLDSVGHPVNVRADKGMAAPAEGLKPMSMIPLSGHGTGLYTIKLNERAAKAGVALDFRQPASKIVMSMKPSTYEHLLGNSDTVDVQLSEAGAPITGATLTGSLLDPELNVTRAVTFTERGQGVYSLAVDGKTLTDADKIGAYLVDVQATGKAPSGVEFHRSGRTGFHFGVPTAKVTNFGATRTLKNAAGLIEAFEVDVTLENLSLDRLELSATLTSTVGGAEHPVAVAFAGDAYDPGKHTITLHFDAGYARLTHLEGSYQLRNFKLFSLGTNTLFQRVADMAMPGFSPVTRAQLRPLENLTPAMEQLITDGVLYRD